MSTEQQLSALRQLIADDLSAVDQTILQRLQSDVVLINQLGHYIINSGGKRLRPILVLLAAGACTHQATANGDLGVQQQTLAAIIEFIHTATLLHDDVVDHSDMRRGNETANAIWGNEASVLVGDFLYSRSFQMMVDIGDMRVMQILADTTNTIAEGEVMQLLNCNDPDVTEQRYMDVIRCKTAILFAAGAEAAAVLAGQDQTVVDALKAYGLHLGTAFQLVDDVLDYTASSDELGKNIGDDLAEGKPTLPLIYTMAHASTDNAELVRQAIKTGGLEQIDAVVAAIKSTDALNYTARMAQQQAELAKSALDALPANAYQQALCSLADLSVQRTF